MTSMVIRAAVLDDAELVANNNAAMAWETERLTLDPHTARLGAQAVLEDPRRGFYLLAQRHGEVVGQLLITYEWSDWRNHTFWWIQSVYIKPEARRAGVFRLLFADVKQRARAVGDICGLRLYVERENHRAQATYEALGMVRAHYDMFELALDGATP